MSERHEMPGDAVHMDGAWNRITIYGSLDDYYSRYTWEIILN